MLQNNTTKISTQEQINQLMSAANDFDMDQLSDQYKKCYKNLAGIPMQKYKKDKNVWSGQGRKPTWVLEHLKSGGNMEELLSPLARYHQIMTLKGKL